MASGWQGSTRRQRLPPDWSRIRKRILRRDGHRCTERGLDDVRCYEVATEVDHIRPGDDHSDANLRALCSWHHQKKSSQEGGAALARKRRAIDQSYRRREAHPGLL